VSERLFVVVFFLACALFFVLVAHWVAMHA